MYAMYQYLYPENIIAKKIAENLQMPGFLYIIFSLQNVVIPTQVYFPITSSLCVYTYTPVYTEMRF